VKTAFREGEEGKKEGTGYLGKNGSQGAAKGLREGGLQVKKNAEKKKKKGKGTGGGFTARGGGT